MMTQSNGNEKRDEHRDELNPGQTGKKLFQFRQKMISIGKDYWIENEQGEKVYAVDGKLLAIPRTFYFLDVHGNKLAKIQKFILTLKETMEVKGPNGEQLALVKKDFFTPLKEHFVINIKDGPDLEIHGNLLDHEYTIGQDQNVAAQVSKKWMALRDNYSVSIEPGQDEVIILCVVLCIDEMVH